MSRAPPPRYGTAKEKVAKTLESKERTNASRYESTQVLFADAAISTLETYKRTRSRRAAPARGKLKKSGCFETCLHSASRLLQTHIFPFLPVHCLANGHACVSHPSIAAQDSSCRIPISTSLPRHAQLHTSLRGRFIHLQRVSERTSSINGRLSVPVAVVSNAREIYKMLPDPVQPHQALSAVQRAGRVLY